jgi:predicted methyltransferase
MKRTVTMLIAATAITTPLFAFQENQQPPSVLDRILDRVLGPVEQTEVAEEAVEPEATSAIEIVLAEDFRTEDRARDRYRHPEATLNFFRVEPTMTVAEFAPGGGWYTRVLAPLIAGQGRYLAVNTDTSGRDLDAEQRARADSWPQRFAASVEDWTGVPAAAITAFESDEIPDDLAGTVDRILIFRSMHGLRNGNIADSELRNLRELLADDGLVGVVQHRAPASETWARSNGTRGYLRQADVIALFRLNGFELVESSEINANPNDPANWERGVWTLPPVLALGQENRDRYVAIGESDRMTLLFRKVQ